MVGIRLENVKNKVLAFRIGKLVGKLKFDEIKKWKQTLLFLNVEKKKMIQECVLN